MKIFLYPGIGGSEWNFPTMKSDWTPKNTTSALITWPTNYHFSGDWIWTCANQVANVFRSC